MLKILRKYKQWLFFGFMGFLAVAWLLPNLGGGNQDPTKAAKEVVGHIGDTKVRLSDLNIAELEFSSAQQYFKELLPLEQLVGFKVENSYHWMLLAREAEQGGFVGGPSDGADWLTELAATRAGQQATLLLQSNPLMALRLIEEDPQVKAAKEKNPQRFEFLEKQPEAISQLLPGSTGILTERLETQFREYLEKARANGNDHMKGNRIPGMQLNDEMFDATIAKIRGIRRMGNAFFGAPRVSDLRLASVGIERLNQAIVDCVVIPAERLKRQIVDPTPEQLTAHFEKYKAEDPTTNLMGVGYLQPERVQLEYLKIDRKAIEGAIKVDEVEVNKRWRTNRERFKGEFSEERPNVEAEMRAEAVKSAMNEAVRIARTEIGRAIKRLPEDGAYRQLPADWATTRLKLQDVALAVQSTIKTTLSLDIPLPVVTSKADAWMHAGDVGKLEGIGTAKVQIGPRREDLKMLLGHLREFVGRNDYALQVGIPFPTEKALEDSEGSAYMFCVLAVKKIAPAETLEEVRAQAVEDFKLLAAFEQMKVDSQKYIDKAAADGLDGLAKVFERAPDDPKTGAGAEKALDVIRLAEVDAMNITQQRRQVEALTVFEGGRLKFSEDFIKKVREVAATLDPKAPPAVGDLAKGDAVKSRLVTVPIAGRRALAVALVVANRPVTVEKMRGVGYQGVDAQLAFAEVLRNSESDGKPDSPFAYEVMKSRMQFTLTKDVTREEKSEAPEKASVPGAPAK